MSCINPILIPDIDCDPLFSVKRIPSYLPAKLDTGNVAEIYDFMPADIDINWVSEVYDLSSPETEPVEAEDCDIGSDLVTESAETPKYISLLQTAVDAAGVGRTWIAPLSCNGSSGDDDEDTPDIAAGLNGAVHFANPRVRNISFPTFIPRSGGRSGSNPEEESPYDQCGPPQVTIVVKFKSSSAEPSRFEKPGIFVNYEVTGYSPTDNQPEIEAIAYEDPNQPSGVLLHQLDEKTHTWCCLLQGIFTHYDRRLDNEYGAVGTKYSMAGPESVIIDNQGSLVYLGGYSFLLFRNSAITIPQNEYYAGIFKLVAQSADTVKIINGRDSSLSYCGSTDVPRLDTIPVTEITLDSIQEWKIILAFFYDTASKRYSAEFVTTPPEDAFYYVVLGTFLNGKVNQIYSTYSTRITLGNDWYLV